MGMIYKRGKMLWIKYYCAGRPNRESTGTTKQKEAERFLKHREGRVVYLSSEVRMLVEEQLERVRTLSRKLERVISYLFPHLTTGHFQGERIRNFRKSWASACHAAGLSGMLRHDLRRTAARNLIRSGVPEVVSMRITGHRTRSVFDRYNIVSPADLQGAARKMAGGHSFGHSAPSPLDSATVSR